MAASGAESPLKAHSCLHIGYGDGGAKPFNYKLEDEQSMDVGFLKLFFSSQYVEMWNITQAPFWNFECAEARKGNYSAPRNARKTKEPREVWLSGLVTVVQCRN